MVFFYLLHNMTQKHQTNDNQTERDGAKNARTFIIGSVFYIILYMMVMHFSLRYDHMAGIFKTGLIMLFGADIATMGYLYKSYYGRNILTEIDDSQDANWKYSDNTHTYSKKTDGDFEMENEIEQLKQDYNTAELNKLKEKYNEVIQK
jgi:hypothetical protein